MEGGRVVCFWDSADGFVVQWRDPKMLIEAFYHFDRDAQGAISTDEWRGIMSSAGKKMRPGEVDDFLAEVCLKKSNLKF